MTAVLPRRNGSPPSAGRRGHRSRSSRHTPCAVNNSRVADAVRVADVSPAADGTRSVPTTWQDRVQRLLARPLEYRVCRGFKRLHVLTHEFHQPILPDYAREVSERTLLPPEQEVDLFVRMNYCKFRADILRRQLPLGWHAQNVDVMGVVAPQQPSPRPSPPAQGVPPVRDCTPAPLTQIRGLTPPGRQTEEMLAEIEDCLATATELRDCLLRAFLKLAISLIGGFVSRQHGFDELLSEAAMALLRAVEKFDPDRGFRFSTYATPAVRRQLERFILKDHRDRHLMVRTAHLDALPAAGGPTRADDRRRQAAVTEMTGMLQRLDAREQAILQARFGLEPGSDPQSLQEVASRLGVCRERVRQLEARALERLRDMPEAMRLMT